jgi:lysophospholipase L1-like esterase
MRTTSLLFFLGFSLLVPTISEAQATNQPTTTPTAPPPPATPAELKAGPQAGQKVAFLGDSITQFGWSNPTGYVHLVDMAMEKQGRKIEVIPAGVSGNTSKDMLARLERDVLSKKPDWMTLSCGVNDVWHGANGVPLDGYKQNITSIVEQATNAGIKVVILTATMIREDQPNDLNQKLIAYNAFLHDLAQQKGLPIADLNADEQAELAKMNAETPNVPPPILTVDGVHMNGLGNEMMAAGILRAFGFTDAQIEQEKAAWVDLPGAMNVAPKGGVSVKDYQQLQALAKSQGKSVDALLSEAWNKDLQALLSMPVSATATPASTNAAPVKP